MKSTLIFSALFLTGCAHGNVSGERIPLEAANADRLYVEESGTIDWGIDVNISTKRNTLRFGGSLVPLIVCSEPESKLCLESEYFSLLIPSDDSSQWKRGDFAFDLLPATTRSPCPSLPLIHVQSDQAGRFFDFYWNDEQGLVAAKHQARTEVAAAADLGLLPKNHRGRAELAAGQGRARHRRTCGATGARLRIAPIDVRLAAAEVRVHGHIEQAALPGRSHRWQAGQLGAAAGVAAHLIGGADVAAELDAKRAIAQGSRVAAGL